MNIQLLAWDIHSLKPMKITKELQKSLEGFPKGEVIDVNFIGVSEHVMLTLRLRDTNRQTYL